MTTWPVYLAGIILIGPDKMPDPWVDPGYNRLLWVQAPHCDERPAGIVVDTIVLHSTVTPTLEDTTKWFMKEESRVSSHFTIGKDGSVMQHVSVFNRAWHAGPSLDPFAREKVNDFSIGIELVNANDGVDPYPEAQIQVLRNLIFSLRRAFPLKQIVSHQYVARPIGRKSDPAGFPWERLLDMGLQTSYGVPPADLNASSISRIMSAGSSSPQ